MREKEENTNQQSAESPNKIVIKRLLNIGNKIYKRTKGQSLYSQFWLASSKKKKKMFKLARSLSA